MSASDWRWVNTSSRPTMQDGKEAPPKLVLPLSFPGLPKQEESMEKRENNRKEDTAARQDDVTTLVYRRELAHKSLGEATCSSSSKKKPSPSEQVIKDKDESTQSQPKAKCLGQIGSCLDRTSMEVGWKLDYEIPADLRCPEESFPLFW
ncbi:hypothetical protein WISP_72308 [Willisornis vidua]|uniref:Uncharacterized protein n=1 Tax=Willisornis vidua TaxID=1566151 RepID=A0ABQ9DBN2_9PASS|nr:hypothetical protein WISP_72308 [Willisornis vidua]